MGRQGDERFSAASLRLRVTASVEL